MILGAHNLFRGNCIQKLTNLFYEFYKKTVISRGPPVRASRTPRGPRTTVWETLA